MGSLCVANNIVEDMDIDEILNMCLEITREQYYSVTDNCWKTIYYWLWLGNVTINNETKPYGIKIYSDEHIAITIGDEEFFWELSEENRAKLRQIAEQLYDVLQME